MRRFILIAITAISTLYAASAAQAGMVRCAESPNGWCNLVPAAVPAARRSFLPFRVGAVGVTESTYQTGGTGATLTDPRMGATYKGAIREGKCDLPGAVFINKEVGCAGRDANPEHMERLRGKISDICGDGHGDVARKLPDGGIAHYSCP